MHDILWPRTLRPGFVDNFVSNEIIVTGLSTAAVFATLVDTRTWAAQYDNATDIHFHDAELPYLAPDLRFAFTTFGLPVQAHITEFVAPEGDAPARIAWHGWVDGNAHETLDVHHAWLFEPMSDDRVRLLTQETQNGEPAKDMARTRPNPMLNKHQEWIEGLAQVARGYVAQ